MIGPALESLLGFSTILFGGFVCAKTMAERKEVEVQRARHLSGIIAVVLCGLACMQWFILPEIDARVVGAAYGTSGTGTLSVLRIMGHVSGPGVARQLIQHLMSGAIVGVVVGCALFAFGPRLNQLRSSFACRVG